MTDLKTSTRRALLCRAGAGALGLAAGSLVFRLPSVNAAETPAIDLHGFRTPYKQGSLILSGSGEPGTFDQMAVDVPFVFKENGRFYLTYVGYDGVGYQTGIAVSDDLVNWTRQGVILPRDPHDEVTRFSVAMASILRDDALNGTGELKKVNGRYLGAWHAYPGAGYEEGPAVIGLAWSDDLRHWEKSEPILRAEDGGDWEKGGLYKPYLVEDNGVYYMFYNAKTVDQPGQGWHEQIGVATSTDLQTWTRHPGNPIVVNGPAGSWDDRFAADPVVYRVGDLWAMYYYGRSTDRACRDLLAIGADPFNFTKTPEIMVDIGPAGSVDETFAHKPALIHHDGALYHFYCAVSGKWPHDVRGLTVARSTPW